MTHPFSGNVRLDRLEDKVRKLQEEVEDLRLKLEEAFGVLT